MRPNSWAHRAFMEEGATALVEARLRTFDGMALGVVLLVGIGLGWILAAVGGAERGGGGSGLFDPADLSRSSGSRGEAELRGRGETVPPCDESPEPTGPDPEAERAMADEVVELVGDSGFEEIVVWEEEWTSGGLGERAWTALLTLYAVASRQADFLRAAPRAIEAGVSPGDVLDCLCDAPLELRPALLDALRAALPDVVFYAGRVADIYIEAGAMDRAVAVLVPALAEEKDADLALRLVRADPERAAAELAPLMADGVFDGSALASIGKGFVEAQHGALGIDFFLEALRLEPRNSEALMALAGVDASLGAAHAETLAQKDPNDAEAWNWLGKIRADAGDPLAAFEAFRRSAMGKPTTDALYGMLDADPARALQVARELTTDVDNDEVHGAVAKIALQGESMGEVLDAVLRAHASDPTDHEWLRAMVMLDPARAVAVLEDTVSDYAGDERDEVIGAHANALRDLGQRDVAFETYLEAHKLDKGDWEWQRGMARADPARALEILQAYKEEGDSDGDLLGAIGDAYAGIGRPDEAMRHYEEAVKNDGGNEWLARMAQVDHEEATTRIQAAIDEKPSEAELWFHLGQAHELAGRQAEATAAFTKACEIEPRNIYYGAKLQKTR